MSNIREECTRLHLNAWDIRCTMAMKRLRRELFGECTDPEHRTRYKFDRSDVVVSRDLSKECMMLGYKRFGEKWGKQKDNKLAQLRKKIVYLEA